MPASRHEPRVRCAGIGLGLGLENERIPQHADLKDGVLTLAIHKTPEAQPKNIAIQSPAKKS